MIRVTLIIFLSSFINIVYSAECGSKSMEVLEFTYMDKVELNKEYCEAKYQRIGFLQSAGAMQDLVMIQKYSRAAESCERYANTVKNILKKEYGISPSCPNDEEAKDLQKNQEEEQKKLQELEKLNPNNINFDDGIFLICSTSDSIDIDKFILGKKKLSLTPEIYFKQVYSLKLKDIKKDIWKIKRHGKDELIKNIEKIDDLTDPYPSRRYFRHTIIDYDLIFISNNFSSENNEGIICVNDFSTVTGSYRSCINSIKASDSYRTTSDKWLLTRRTLQYNKPGLTRGKAHFCKTSYSQNQISALIKNYEDQIEPYLVIKKHLNYVLENWDQGENKI